MSIKQLWAPWRMDYLTEEKKPAKATQCVFCDLLQENRDRENLILHRTENVFVILNKYPYNNGHLMVVPNRHVSDLLELPDAEFAEIGVWAKRSVAALNATYKSDGFNIGMNLGLAGGAGIRNHLHLHVVPRWNGDTNFMPVLADVKSMPEHLLASFDKLHEHF